MKTNASLWELKLVSNAKGDWFLQGLKNLGLRGSAYSSPCLS